MSRPLLVLAFALAAGTLALVASTRPASAQALGVPLYLRADHSGRCLQAPAAGTPSVVPCWQAPMWTIEAIAGTDSVRLRNGAECLYANADGRFSTHACASMWADKYWKVIAENGKYRIMAVHPGKCLYANADGRFGLASCAPVWPDHYWQLDAEPVAHSIRADHGGRCLSLGGPSAMSSCDSAPLVRIRSIPGTSAVLLDRNGSCMYSNPTGGLGAFTCNAQFADQHWELIAAGASWRLRSVHTNGCLYANADGRFAQVPCAPTYADHFWTIRADSAPPTVVRFAPVLSFGAAAKGYPMSAQRYWDALAAGDPRLVAAPSAAPAGFEQATLDPAAPTYFQVATQGNQVRIHYWWFYGMDRSTCGTQHYGDWEHVMVTLSEDRNRVVAVTFFQGSAHYTRLAAPVAANCAPGHCDPGFEATGGRPVVYVGERRHGTFHSPGPSWFTGLCEDRDTFTAPATRWNSSWTLVDLSRDSEPWMTRDRASAIRWGPPAASTPYDSATTQPTRLPPSFSQASCSDPRHCPWSTCLSGDYQSEQPDTCARHCPTDLEPVVDGYTLNWYCFHVGRPGGFVIGRLVVPASFGLKPSRSYPHRFTLPVTDAGLARPTNLDSDEATLPAVPASP